MTALALVHFKKANTQKLESGQTLQLFHRGESEPFLKIVMGDELTDIHIKHSPIWGKLTTTTSIGESTCDK